MDRSKLHPTMARNKLSPDRERIRRLFLHRQDVYTLRESAELLDMSRGTLIREASLDRPDAYRVGNRWRFTWRQLVYVALRRWSLGEIHAALGSDASAVLPPLLTLRSFTVTLPEDILRALETLASDHETTVDQYLLGELIDFAGSVSWQVEGRIPGYRRAYLFPSQE